MYIRKGTYVYTSGRLRPFVKDVTSYCGGRDVLLWKYSYLYDKLYFHARQTTASTHDRLLLPLSTNYYFIILQKNGEFFQKHYTLHNYLFLLP